MEENFDSFPSNIAEMMGPIPRESFNFGYYRFEVWQGGQCVHSGHSENEIAGRIVGEDLHVTIEDSNVNQYIKKRFTFGEISTNLDRVMWSKDIFGQTGAVERYNPDICSMFYKNGVLSKVTFTIHDPNILIEFYLDENRILQRSQNSNVKHSYNDSEKNQPGLNWVKVLEIETFMHKMMTENAMFFQVRLWEEGKKHNMTLDKNHTYQQQDIKSYLFKKYPNNEFFRNAEQFIDQLFNHLMLGNRLIKVDNELYRLNEDSEQLQTSDLEQRLKFLEAYNESVGVDIFWYNILKEIILKIRGSSPFNRDEIVELYLGCVNNKLNEIIGCSIYDLDDEILPRKWNSISKSHDLDINLFSKFDTVKERILSFEENTIFKVYQKSCTANDYEFYYKNADPSEVLKDSIAFSINLTLDRIIRSGDELIGYELRKSTSLYPQDLIRNPERTLMVYITPFGFYKFEEIDKLFKEDKLNEFIQSVLSKEFEPINCAAIVDNEDWVSEWNRLNSSLIVGRNLTYRTFWGRRTKEYVDKMISGEFWYNDDVHGTYWGFIGLHPDTAYEGEQKYSMPAKNVLYYYSELRLEKGKCNRELSEIYEAGYRDDESDDNEYEDYDEW